MLQSAVAAQQNAEARHRRESRLSKSRASATHPRSPLDLDHGGSAGQHGEVFEADDDEDAAAARGIPRPLNREQEQEEATATSSNIAAVNHEGEGVQRRKSRSSTKSQVVGLGGLTAVGDKLKLSTLTKSPQESKARLQVEQLEEDDDDVKLPETPAAVYEGTADKRFSTAFTPAGSIGPASGYTTPARMDIDARSISLRSMLESRTDDGRRRRGDEIELDEMSSRGVMVGSGPEMYEEGGDAIDASHEVFEGADDTGAFTLLFLYLGVLYSWGVYQAYFVTNKVASSLALSAVGGVQVFMQAIGCLPASYILPRLGQRYTVLLGICIISASLILCSFSLGNIGGLMFLHGITFGCGGALVYLTSYTAPSQWFDKKRGLCTGIASCGAGLGGAVYSIITERLMAAWGPAWTYRFFGLITLAIGAPIAFLLRQGPITQSSPTLVAQGLSARAQKPIFRSSRFIRILVAVFIASYPFFIPPYFIPQYAQSVGLSAAQGALYNTLFNVASAIGRIGFGVVADNMTGSITAWSLSILLIALSSLLVWPQAVDQPLIILFVFLCGLGSGGFFTLQSSVVAQIIGLHRLHSGVSYLEVAGSFGFLAGPISAGALLDAFGGVEAGAKAYKPAIVERRR